VLVAVDFDGTLSPFVLDPMQARAVPGGIEVLRAAAGLGGVIAAIVSRRDLATLAAKSASNPTTFAQPLRVRSAEQPGSVDPHRQRWSTQTAHHFAAESQNQAAPSPRAHERMTPQPAGSRRWHGQEALVAAGWVQPMPAEPPRMRIGLRTAGLLGLSTGMGLAAIDALCVRLVVGTVTVAVLGHPL
jgi:hypothetical protein